MGSNSPSELAFQLLRLEQQLDSYQRLHVEELEQLRQALRELKTQILALAAAGAPSRSAPGSTSQD